MERVVRAFSDSRVQLVATAVAASAATAGALWGVRRARRSRRTRRLKRDALGQLGGRAWGEEAGEEEAEEEEEENGGAVGKETAVVLTANEESLVREQLARHYAFLGDEGMARVRGGFVVVVGAGGVGSWAAMLLVRAGVQRMRIVDFDQVTLSSLNRHAAATRATVGTAKAEALRASFREIAPHARVEARVALFGAETADELLAGAPDFVLDCIDNIDTKVVLLAHCARRGLRVVSAMGAGMKADPSRVQLADIGNTFEDPLSRAVRRRLKAAGVQSGITAVYSSEKPGRVQLASLAESQQDAPGDFAVLPDFRVRTVPVLGTMPAMFGAAMATHVLTELAGFATEPLPIKGRHAMYTRIQRELGNRERDRDYASTANGSAAAAAAAGPALHMSTDDCAYMLEEIWRGRSAVSGATDKLALTRWRRDRPMTTSNCICLTKAEADAHDRIEGRPEDHYPPDVVAFVEQRLAEERRLGAYR